MLEGFSVIMAQDKTSRQQTRPSVTPPATRTVKIKQAAVLLGICENSVRRLIDRDKLRTIRALRHHLIPVSEIERFLSGE